MWKMGNGVWRVCAKFLLFVGRKMEFDVVLSEKKYQIKNALKIGAPECLSH